MLAFLGWIVLIAITAMASLISVILMVFSTAKSTGVGGEEYTVWLVTLALWIVTIYTTPFSITFTG